jgi:hypothetical protein
LIPFLKSATQRQLSFIPPRGRTPKAAPRFAGPLGPALRPGITAGPCRKNHLYLGFEYISKTAL